MWYFLTFANTRYMKTNRIMREAESFGMFDRLVTKSELDIPDYIAKHQQFITDNPYGYGLWIWKPKIILDQLREINDNDFLLYCDAGSQLNAQGKARLYEYVANMEKQQASIVTFGTSPNYWGQIYVKMDAIMDYFPAYANDRFIYRYAGVMLLKKTPQVVQMITEWLELCENHHFLDRSGSVKYPDYIPGYQGNDCDNGLFNLCLAKHAGIDYMVYPDETNLYDERGYQLPHGNYDWSRLTHTPIHNKRLTPRFGHFDD